MKPLLTTLGELRNSVGLLADKPFLEEGHEFESILVDAHGTSGLLFRVSYDRRERSIITQPLPSFAPGQAIPVRDAAGRGRRTWVYPVWRDNSDPTVHDPNFNDHRVLFWLMEKGDVAHGYTKRLQYPGDSLGRISSADTLTAGSSLTIATYADVTPGLPVFIQGVCRGGVEPAGSAIGFPLELRLRQYSAGGADHGRVWIFPGHGVATFQIQVARNYFQTDSERWLLEVHNPTGAAGTKSNWSIDATLFMGYCNEHWRSRGMVKHTAADQDYASFIGLNPSGRWGYGVHNYDTGTATLRMAAHGYIDTLNGGPKTTHPVFLGAGVGNSASGVQDTAVHQHVWIGGEWNSANPTTLEGYLQAHELEW